MMGQRIQQAGQRWIDRSKAPIQRMYEQASIAAGDAPIMGREIVAELDQRIAQLGRNPNTNRALLNYLRTVRADFVNQAGQVIPKTVDDLRSIRTNLSAEISRRNLTKTSAERLVGRALDKARKDIDRDLYDAGAMGIRARELYREADVLWGQRGREIRQVVERVIGPLDNPLRGDQVMRNVRSMLASGAEGRTQVVRLWEKLNPQEQLDAAATIAARFGRRSPDEPFSPALFVAATRTIPPSSRALLFGKEGARSIANLRALSKAYVETSGALNNSRSGMVQNWGAFLRNFTTGGTIGTLLGGLPGGATGAAAGTVLSGVEMLSRRLSARTLMSNDMSRWLERAPRATDEPSIRRHVDKLSWIAARNPAIAQEALGLQKALMEVFEGQSTTRIQASPQAEENRQQQR